MRFLADMGISLKTVAWLRSEGHDVVHLCEEGLQRLPDEEIFKKGITESRIILTILKFFLPQKQSCRPQVLRAYNNQPS